MNLTKKYNMTDKEFLECSAAAESLHTDTCSLKLLFNMILRLYGLDEFVS